MQIEKIIQLMQTDDSVDAPEDAIKRARSIFRQAVREPKRSLLQRIVAILQADLSPNEAAFGERSASMLKARQLLYTAGETGIDLRVAQAGGKVDIHGQLLGDELQPGLVKIFNDKASFETETDELGEFVLSSIGAEAYSMMISLGAKEIYIEKIDLR